MTRHRVLCAFLLLAGESALAGTSGFTDVTAAAGIGFVQTLNTDLVRRLTGGAAACDVNLDGHVDLYVTRHDLPDILYLGDGLGGFTYGTLAAFPGGTSQLSNGVGCADIDNDGDPDLMVTTLYDTRYYLYINDGSGVFSEEAVARGVSLDGINTYGWSVAFGDYDKDGWLDMYLGEWRQDFFEAGGTPNRATLFRNLGPEQPGHFEDRTVAAGVEREPGLFGLYRFAPAFVDLDLDSWPDLVIAADFGTSKLYWNDGNGTFSDGTAAAMIGTECCGMGSTFGDYDGDGLLDWYVTAIDQPLVDPAQDGNRLFRNLGNRVFSDETDAAGVRNGYFGWGTSLFDYDNDGDLDIVATTGMMGSGMGLNPMRFWDNTAAVFTERSAAAGLSSVQHGQGLLVFDYDEDGDLDVFVMFNAGQPVLYRNDYVGVNRHLRIRLTGSSSNRDAYGARVRVWDTLVGAPQVRSVGANTHYLGQSERTLHFGLGPGAATVAKVEIDWPSGALDVYEDLVVNTTHSLAEAAPIPALPPALLLLLGALLSVGTAGILRRALRA